MINIKYLREGYLIFNQYGEPVSYNKWVGITSTEECAPARPTFSTIGGTSYINLDPVPLDRLWLHKLGFDATLRLPSKHAIFDERVWMFNKTISPFEAVSLELDQDGKFFIITEKGDVEINHVHQLQHYIYTTFNKDLAIDD